MSNQPDWEFVANLGDVNPIEHDGLFIYRDRTGVYGFEGEKLFCNDYGKGWTSYRFILESCTYQNGILSDNKYHPDFPAWFADKIPELSRFTGQSPEELIAGFCSDDPRIRGLAYETIGQYFGYHELDSEPNQFKTRAEVEKRFAGCF